MSSTSDLKTNLFTNSTHINQVSDTSNSTQRQLRFEVEQCLNGFTEKIYKGQPAEDALRKLNAQLERYSSADSQKAQEIQEKINTLLKRYAKISSGSDDDQNELPVSYDVNIDRRANIMNLRTASNTEHSIFSENQAKRIVFEQAAKLNQPKNHDHLKNLTSEQVCELNDQLQRLLAVYHLHITNNPNPAYMQGKPVQYIQVLEGRVPYIGTLMPTELISQAQKACFEKLGLGANDFIAQSEPHMTFVPPSSDIEKDTIVGQLVEFNPFEVEFNKFTLNRRYKTLVLHAGSDQFDKLAKELAFQLDVDSTARGAHCLLGKLRRDAVDRIFKDPSKYGLKVDPSNSNSVIGDTESLNMIVGRLAKEHPLAQRLSIRQEVKHASKEAEQKALAKYKEAEENFKKICALVEDRKAHFLNTGDTVVPVTLKAKDGKEVTTDHKITYTKGQLELALKGRGEHGRIPLTFSVRCEKEGDLEYKMWYDFKKEVIALFHKYQIRDAVIQVLGSGIHGFSRNPFKGAKPWSIKSDLDIAVFSRVLSENADRWGLQINEKIQLNGKYTVFKNGRSRNSQGLINKPGMGFGETSFGDALEQLQSKWSEKLYKHVMDKDEYEGDEVDFKLNIGLKPFHDAVTITS